MGKNILVSTFQSTERWQKEREFQTEAVEIVVKKNWWQITKC